MWCIAVPPIITCPQTESAGGRLTRRDHRAGSIAARGGFLESAVDVVADRGRRIRLRARPISCTPRATRVVIPRTCDGRSGGGREAARALRLRPGPADAGFRASVRPAFGPSVAVPMRVAVHSPAATPLTILGRRVNQRRRTIGSVSHAETQNRSSEESM